MEVNNIKIRFSENHPCLAGHFPGRPIIPGAVILDKVVQGLKNQIKGSKLIGITNVKFHSPLQPETEINISYDVISNNNISFICTNEGDVIAKGQFCLSSGD